MLFKDYLVGAAVTTVYARSIYLVLYLQSYELFTFAGAASLYLMICNIGFTTSSFEKNDEHVKRDPHDVWTNVVRVDEIIEKYLSPILLLLAYTGDPVCKSIELVRLHGLMMIGRKSGTLSNINLIQLFEKEVPGFSSVKPILLQFVRKLRNKGSSDV